MMDFQRQLAVVRDIPRLVCLGAGILAASLLAVTGIGRLFDLQVSSFLFRSLGTRFEPSPDVILVSIDDASLQFVEPTVGRWPWPRSYLARLVEACEGCDSMGVDILFLERDLLHPQGDSVFAEALHKHGRVALAGVFVDGLVRGPVAGPSGALKRSLVPLPENPGNSPPEKYLNQFLAPLPSLTEGASRIGHANFLPSIDNILHSYPYFIVTDHGLLPSLATATLMASPRHSTMVPGPGMELNTRELLFYDRPFVRYSAIDLLSTGGRRPPPNWTAGKIVLIGVEAEGLYDLVATPLKNKMSGLGIHATALSNRLQQRWITSPSRLTTWLFACLVSAIPLLFWNLSLPSTLFRWGLFITGWLGSVCVLFYGMAFRAPCAEPCFAFLAAATCRLVLWIQQELKLRRRLEELQDMRKMLGNMLIHDLRAPLTSVQMLIGSVLLRETSLQGRERLEMASSECSRLANLLKSLLDVQRMEANRMELKPTHFLWDDLLQEIAGQLGHRIQTADLQLKIMSHPSVELYADRGLMGRILTNLLDNAVRFANPGTVILCDSVVDPSEGKNLVTRITDRGPTVDPSAQEKIFEVFFQGGQLEQGRAQSGFGLGLAFCKLAVTAHGGKIRCISPAPGFQDGACFEFSVPIHQVETQMSVEKKVIL